MSTTGSVHRLKDSAHMPEALKARARAIAPDVRARADHAARVRDTAPELIAAIRDAGLLRMFQPERWGGLEADPRTFYDVQNILSEACASMGWVYGVLSVQSFVIALFNEQAQADVWGEDGDAVASSCFMPLGVAEPVDGGFRLTGRWTFSSGSTHAQWALLGAKIPGAPAPAAGPPPLRLFLVPRADVRIIDTWHTFGLRGTGSNDLVVEDAFVPAHRTHVLDPGILPIAVDARPGPALYRLPWLYLFASSISNFAIGAARNALAAFLDINTTRVAGFTGKVAKDDPAVHQIAAKMRGAIDTAEAMYDRHVGRLLEHAETDAPLAPADAWLMRVQMTGSVRTLAGIADEMMLMLGGRGIREDSPFTRIWLDLMAARGHIGNDPSGAGTMLGKMLLDEVAASA